MITAMDLLVSRSTSRNPCAVKFQLVAVSVSALVILGFSGIAQAGAITSLTLDDCDSLGCQGSTLFLSVEEEVGGTWFVTYTINTDGYTGDRIGFNQIGFKAVKGWTDVVLLDAPPDAGSWPILTEAPTNANSLCSNTKGNSDKVCTAGFSGDITGGGDWTWTFRLTGGTLDTSEWHLGGQYANSAGETYGKIISADAAPGLAVPEPSAALLFGVGALLMGRRARRHPPAQRLASQS
jgi:hypothetical protein